METRGLSSTMSFLTLEEKTIIPDKYYKYDRNAFEDVPIAIDNGAYNCRVGFASDDKPRLIFRNLIAKLRGKKDQDVMVGNDITNLEAVKWLLRSPFETNVVTQFDTQETVFDHVFSHLGINDNTLDHPIVINEAPGTPLCCRSNMFELLFECYQTPSILTGIDALFSYYYNIPEVQDCIIVSFGHHTCHVLPIIRGNLLINHCCRINLGGFNLTLYLQRLLQLKYPKFAHEFTFTKCERMVHEYAKYAVNYREEVLKWADEAYFDSNVAKFKFGKSSGNITTSVVVEKFSNKMTRLLNKVKGNLTKKRERTLVDLEENRKKLKTLQELLEDEEIADQHLVTRALLNIGVKNASDLRQKLSEINQDIKLLKVQLDPKQEAEDTVLDEIKEWLRHNTDENKLMTYLTDLKRTKDGENLWILLELCREYESDVKRFKRFGGLEDIVELGPEKLRVSELLFSPESLIKFEQCGISEAVRNVMEKCKDDCGQNIFITGGPALLEGVKDRIEYDVRSVRPFQAPLEVYLAKNPILNAWDGAKKAASDFKKNFISIKEYKECGPHYIKEYRLSNLWNSTCEF